MFKNIDYNQELFLNSLGKQFPNKIDLELFLEYINHDYISISGSSILQIIQEELYKSTDLDIYIEISNLNEFKINNIKKLIRFLHNFIECDDLYLLYDLNKISSMSVRYINPIINQEYISLRQYIKLYQLFENKKTNFKIELIYIKCDIEYMLENTFDYDIIKNYWKQNKIYSFNQFAIINKVATMSLTHFIKRIILGAKIEFKNFLKRYNKYLNRGFLIFIHKTCITKHIIDHIIKLYKPLTISEKRLINNIYTKWIKNNIYYIDKNHFVSHNILFIKLNINNTYYLHNVLSKDLIYVDKNKPHPLIVSIPSYIIKYLLIAGIIQKTNLYKRLNYYSNLLLEKYLHPDSPFILYQNINWGYKNQKDKTKIYYINKNNKLSIIRLIQNK